MIRKTNHDVVLPGERLIAALKEVLRLPGASQYYAKRADVPLYVVNRAANGMSILRGYWRKLAHCMGVPV